MNMRIRVTIGGIALALGMAGAFYLGSTTRGSPPLGDAEIAYRLERAGEIEVHRARLLSDELRIQGSQCIPNAAMPTLVKWAQKCVIQDCTIVDGAGRTFAGISVPPAEPSPAGQVDARSRAAEIAAKTDRTDRRTTPHTIAPDAGSGTVKAAKP